MQNYNFIQKLLHDFVFRKKFINKSLFEIEKILFLKEKKIENERHVFITSLPRSGTTSILNFIYNTNEYASLTYNNMPFVLSPYLSKFFLRKNIIEKDRIHNDGIKYNLNSPEAFDEIFFNNNQEFIKNELLNYLKLILLSKDKSKYLSKNNLNYKKINLISSILPNSNFLIPIREPLQQSYSLFNQHLHFSELQKKNDFVRRYMNYLGHNEFGLNHKSWNNSLNFNDLNNINYWLEQWVLFYQNIYDKYKYNNNCIFVVYEKLTDLNYLKFLCKKITLNKFEDLNLKFFKNYNKEINVNYDNNIYTSAKNIYSLFKTKFIYNN